MDKFFTADQLVEKRRTAWQLLQSETADYDLRRAIAHEIIRNDCLVKELKEKPEKLIELMFVIADKKQNTVPFFLNTVQKDFIVQLTKTKKEYEKKERSSISIVVLKGRQQGFTSLITAYQLACTLLSRNFEGMTVADDQRNAETIFENKAKFIYNRLPEILRPTEKYNNRHELRFSRLSSGWNIQTAANQMGRSRTINFLHASECAFWRFGIARVQAALGEALTPDCIKIFESTACGFNDYYEMWHSKAHKTLFYPWWNTPEYSLDFATEDDKKRFSTKLRKGDSWLCIRLRWLKKKGLSTEQLHWYSEKYNSYLDKALIRQEYPCCCDDAFIFSGRAVFDNEAVMQRKNATLPPLKTGRFNFKLKTESETDRQSIEDISFLQDINGNVSIYEDPKEGVPYVIGGDIAGEGSECFCAQVLDNRAGKQVAVYHAQYDEAAYAEQIFCLGRYYNDALIGTEVNSGIYASELLRRWRYPRLYHREKVDTYSGTLEPRYGFKTTSLTRPLIISGFVNFCRDNLHLIADEGTFSEMLHFIRDENGRETHRRGSTDDRIIAYAIALFVGGQQRKVIMLPQREGGVFKRFVGGLSEFEQRYSPFDGRKIRHPKIRIKEREFKTYE